MPPTTPQPFSSDLDYLEHEFGWIRAKAQRIAAERAAKEPNEDFRKQHVGETRMTGTLDAARRVPALKKAEEDARADIDHRLAASRAAGRILGLDALCTEHSLSAFERVVLLLGTLAAIGEKFGNFLDGVGRSGYWGGNLTPDVLWDFCESGLAERIESRKSFLPTAALIKNGLVCLQIGPTTTPANLATAYVEITSKAFAKIVGVPELDVPAEGKDEP